MNWSEAHEAVKDARRTIENGDTMIRGAAELMANRLRAAEIDGDVLAEFKRELQQFDSRTRRWKKW